MKIGGEFHRTPQITTSKKINWKTNLKKGGGGRWRWSTNLVLIESKWGWVAR